MKNTSQNGKGSTPRKGVNYKAYREAEIWDILARNKSTKSEPTSLKCSSPAEPSARS